MVNCSYVTSWRNNKARFCPSAAHEAVVISKEKIVFLCSHHAGVTKARSGVEIDNQLPPRLVIEADFEEVELEYVEELAAYDFKEGKVD